MKTVQPRERTPSPYLRFELRPDGKYKCLKTDDKVLCSFEGCEEMAVRFEPQARVMQIHGGMATKKRQPLAYCAPHYTSERTMKWQRRKNEAKPDTA